MRIVCFSNFLNHHQKPVADILALTEGIEYTFVETIPMNGWLKAGGYTDYSQEPYVLRAWENDENMNKAKELAKTADVALFSGFEVLFLEIIRARHTDKLSFEISERWLKRGLINLFSPRLLKSQWYYHTLFRKKKFYKLCSSAFTAKDQHLLFSYKDKCYKWGYFTNVSEKCNVIEFNTHLIRIMWCSRFLRWKHPELPIKLAACLKSNGYKFHINMFGSGEMFAEIKKMAEILGVEDVLSFEGNRPNVEILKEMSEHDIFLFTSDRNEGWGAVCNEAMSQGCAVVGSDQIGSVPFLIKDDEDGLIFESNNIDSLYSKVKDLLDNPEKRNKIRKNAIRKIQNMWSPQIASKNLLTLINDLQNGRDTSIKEGPCSKA